MKRQIFGVAFFMVFIFFPGFVCGAISGSQQTDFYSEQTIQVTSPNGGENWDIGSTRNITWTSTGEIYSVKIEYSTDNGIQWTEIASSTLNTGTYTWTVPDIPSSNCKIRVSNAPGGEVSDDSDSTFSIFSPTITVISPNGGESWRVNSLHDITWEWTGTIDNVKIEYSTDSGSSWTEIASSTVNEGTYNWTVPDTPSSNCKVRVSDASDEAPADESDSTFSIVPPPPIPAAEREALIALYNTTGGDSWDFNDGWKDGPLEADGFGTIGSEGTWFGVTVDNIAGENHVTKIDLYNNNLIGSIPTGLVNFSNLQELTLHNNQLSGGIPAGLGNLSNLTRLYLNSNHLSGRIPAGLGNLSNLTRLFLNNNQLSGPIPGDLQNLTQLESPNVDIGYNCLYTHNDTELQDWLDSIDPDWETNQSQCNAEPTITITSPDSNFTVIKDQGINIDISWIGTDPENNAKVSIGIDSDNIYGGSIDWKVVDTLSLDDSYTWNTSGVSTGTYYILGLIKDEENDDYDYSEGWVKILEEAKPPEVVTKPVTEDSISSVRAVCEGEVTSDGGSFVTARGVCWSTSGNPTTADPDRVTSNGTGIGGFTGTITGLDPATTYYARAYATNSVGTSYGNEVNFKTAPETPMYTLYVKSTPVTGVAIDVSPVDNNGNGNGNTHFTRTYDQGTTVTLTAPATHHGSTFLKWLVDGVSDADQTITVTMDNNLVVRAAYQSATYTLTVQSSPTSEAPITVRPLDNNGKGDGNTEFFRTYYFNTVVTLTALPSYKEKKFVKWLINGTGNTDQSVEVTMNRNHTAHAVFQSPTYTLTVQSSPSPGVAISVSPDDNNGDGDGNTNFTRTYNSGTDVKLTAPSSINGDAFINWEVDGQGNTNRTIQFTIESNHTAAAYYETSNPPEISVNRTSLNFGYIIGSSNKPKETFTIYNSGGGTLNWNVNCDQAGVSLNPASGTNYGVVEVKIDPVSLSAGKSKGMIYVSSDPLVSNSPVKVTIKLWIREQSESSPPFGSFDTPLDGSTVSSSVPVTGWAIGDTGIENVKIYREDGANRVFIGDAVFVEGARPDIEEAYPDYPMNYKAGWGYMMLTNFLPNGGNGVFKIHAIATDKEDNTKILGIKTITVDNANAVKPFGAIDTPGQGGTASGGSFVNWGWVLTPQPNSIPIDGSTINVYVDGVNLGHPTYNIYREDIADLFPDYTNSSGAAGYFYLDTTAYANGVHTIQWVATDNAGNRDGIGSRYFTIINTGTPDSSEQSHQEKPRPYTKIPDISQIADIPVDYSGPVRVKRGFKEDMEPQVVIADDGGINRINIKELERIQIDLTDLFYDGSTSKHFSANYFTGYLLVNNRLQELPVGSTMDTQRGIFYWLPGAGFIGDYEFLFIKTGVNGRKKVRIKINILPKFSKQ